MDLNSCSMLARFPIFHRVKLLEGENVREGFINRPKFEAGAEQIGNEDVRDIVRFLYNSACVAARQKNWNGRRSTCMIG